jgi:hypothetical protein
LAYDGCVLSFVGFYWIRTEICWFMLDSYLVLLDSVGFVLSFFGFCCFRLQDMGVLMTSRIQNPQHDTYCRENVKCNKMAMFDVCVMSDKACGI